MAFDQFLPDYFAECEEHLGAMRRVLLDLEERGTRATPDPARIQDLFRALHTLKGLSGMVGLASAERLAHALEDGLRSWRADAEPLSAEAVQAIFHGVGLLEACIAAKRDGSETPALGDFLRRLERMAPDSGAGDPPAAPDPVKPVADAAGATLLYRFEFTPTAELADRGVGVEAVRARLTALGRIRTAAPRLGGEGGIVFEFVVEVPPGAGPDEAWRMDNLSWRMLGEAGTEGGTPQPARAAAAEATDAVRLASGSLLRVEIGRVDELMRMVGELVVTRARLHDALRQLPDSARGPARETLQESAILFERQLRSLREGITRIRLVHVGEVFERLRFAVRELARESGKRILFEVDGQDTEIDKMVVERMLEPLLHIVRNAVSHGIETPEQRVAHGKPAEGRICLSASAAGDRITITVEDDGAGIDAERVAARAAERGLLQGDVGSIGETLLDVLSSPGFSTREEADLASGRGVGMAVARATVRELGGEISLTTSPGEGTRFSIELPLTLLIVDALLVEVAGQVLAVPQPVLREVFQLDPATVTPFERNEVVPYREGALPLIRLRSLFGLSEGPRGKAAVLVVGTAAQPVGLVVDRLLGLREIVVQPVTDPLVALPGVGGATELSDGSLSLVLDAPALVRLARDASGAVVARQWSESNHHRHLDASA